MVLNVVISAAVQELRNFGPTVPVLLVKLEDFEILFLCPTILLNVGVQVVVPTFTALLTDATLQIMGYLAPVLSAVQTDLIDEKAILLLGPGALDHLRVEDFLPSVQTLDVCAILESLSNAFPVFGAHLLDQLP